MLNVTLDGGGRRMVWLRFRIIGSRREQDLKESWWFAIERRGERRKKKKRRKVVVRRGRCNITPWNDINLKGINFVASYTKKLFFPCSLCLILHSIKKDIRDIPLV